VVRITQTTRRLPDPWLTLCFKNYRDAFQRRERAAEDFAIKQREKEKLLELKNKLAEQQAHLQQLSDHM
jgi:hypothetical protein